MKIIKQGITTFKATCPVCGCEFEYNREDITTEFQTWRRVKCPCCGELINHKETPEKLNGPDITYENMPSIPEGKTLQYEGQERPAQPSAEPLTEQPHCLDVNPLSRGLHDDVRCPYCGESDYSLTGSSCTLMYCETRIKDGKVVSKDSNIHTTNCRCNHCGKTFKIVNGKTEK